MVPPVDAGFVVFHSRLTPTTTESQAAKAHRASIQDCLQRNFGLRRFFRSGSFGNGTSIRGYSDVDYFAVIPRQNLHANSGATLAQVCGVLDARFPRTGVHVDAPAVVVPFGTDASETTEVVPADAVGNHHNYPVFDIPDGTGGWMRASPEAHNAFVGRVDDRLRNKVKPLVRFIKAWKYFGAVPISSFYLELHVAAYAQGEGAIVYGIDVARIFERLWDGQLAAFPDPMGVSGSVQPSANSAERGVALAALARAVANARNAREAEAAGQLADAFRWWDRVFYGRFPAYG